MSKRHPNLTAMQKKEIVNLLKEGTKSLQEIADIFNLSPNTVLKYRTMALVPKRVVLSDEQKIELVELRKKGMEVPDLMKRFQVSHSTVYYILARHGMPIVPFARNGKLSEEERKQIIEQYKAGRLVSDIARDYAISPSAIYHHHRS